VHICSPEFSVTLIESRIESRADILRLALPLRHGEHLEAIREGVLSDHEPHVAIGRHNALEGGRENESSLVVYLRIVFAKKLDHKSVNNSFTLSDAKVEIIFHFLPLFYKILHKVFNRPLRAWFMGFVGVNCEAFLWWVLRRFCGGCRMWWVQNVVLLARFAGCCLRRPGHTYTKTVKIV
jgi:hypothetical protein